METLEENLATIKLCNKQGLYTYLDVTEYKSLERLHQKLPVTIIINDSPERIHDAAGGTFSYKDVKTFMEKETGLYVCQPGTFNTIMFKMTYEIDECDHSNLEVKILPAKDGEELYLHVLLGNVEVKESPMKISIVKSEKQKQLEADQMKKILEEKANAKAVVLVRLSLLAGSCPLHRLHGPRRRLAPQTETNTTKTRHKYRSSTI